MTGELKRYAVRVQCTARGIPPTTPLVFATSKHEAPAAAIEKMRDTYRRHQNRDTRWVVTGEPQES